MWACCSEPDCSFSCYPVSASSVADNKTVGQPWTEQREFEECKKEKKWRLKMENMDCALSLIFNNLEHLVRMGKSESIGG